MNNKRKQKSNCPRCRKRGLVKIEDYKKEWWFGKRSKPRKILKKIKCICERCRYRKVVLAK